MHSLRQLSQYFGLISVKTSKESQRSTDVWNINQMPNEILVKIFGFLDFKSQMKAHSVCNLWRRVIDSILEIETNVIIIDYKNSDKDYDSEYQKVFALKEFKSKKTYEKISSEIISKHFALRELTLEFNDNKCQKNVIKMVADSCDSPLKELSVKTVSKLIVDTKEVEIFCQKFPNLKAFRLNGKQVLIEQKSFHIMIKVWQRLQTLCVRQLSYRDKGDFKLVNYNGIPFRDISPEIRVIKLSAYVFDNIAVTYLQLNDIHGIEKLTIDWIRDFTPLKYVNNCCPNISKLWLSIHPEVLNQNNVSDLWSTIALFKNLKKLGVLYPSNNKVVVCQESIKKLANGPKLSKLSIESANMSSDSVEAIAQHLPHLKALNLMYANFIVNSDESIAPICQMPYLRAMRLYVIPDISEQMLIRLITECSQIELIDVPLIKTLSADSMNAIINRANSHPEVILHIKVSPHLRESFKQFDPLLPKNLIIRYFKPRVLLN